MKMNRIISIFIILIVICSLLAKKNRITKTSDNAINDKIKRLEKDLEYYEPLAAKEYPNSTYRNIVDNLRGQIHDLKNKQKKHKH
jgi:polyhydroxyalkanoate synthesis regulator phasin